MLEKRLGIACVAASVVFMAATQTASAQSRLQDPDGRQTVAPSQMPQQPSLSEEFTTRGKINQKVVPPSNLDQPGIPGIEDGAPQTNEPRGFLPNSSNPENNKQRTGQKGNIPQDKVLIPGERPDPGAIVYPQGFSSSVRIGPMEPVPTWQRGILAFFLLFQTAVITVLGIAMAYMHKVHDDRYQGGKIIREDYREPIGHRRHAGL